jgi:3-deoxy-D-manno-octulosonic-acid transferase
MLIFVLYRIALTAAFPFILAYVLFRGIKDRRYFINLSERFGFLPSAFQRTAPGAVWLHAVSVGEVLSSVELLRRIRASQPAAALFVSCSTLAGRALAEEKLTGLADAVFYVPIDFCWAVRRVLRTIRPALVVVMETEIWPNLFRESIRSGAKLLVVNGRISNRAAPKYQRWKWFFNTVLQQPDAILAQSEADRRNYIALGAPPDRVRYIGNLKYDFNPDAAAIAEPIQRFLSASGNRKIWIAASTMPSSASVTRDDPDEDDEVIAAFRQLEDVLLILVPRKPERFDIAAGKFQAAGINFVRRTSLKPDSIAPVLLLDSIGELSGLFSVADVVLMGGSLARRGGHNILEPALFGKAIIVGPHMENFAEIALRFSDASALMRIQSANDLAGAVKSLLSNDVLRREMGDRARQAAESQTGATARALEIAMELYDQAIPRKIVYGPLQPVLWPLAQVWSIGGRVKRRIALARQKRLPKPVISIGGIAMGGSGKTPLVAYLSEKLSAHNPAILTRGYRRQSPESSTIVPRGEATPVELTGDEAQIFVCEGTAHIGIGRDRARTGALLASKLDPGVFLLDDGFQHASLHRDVDIVTIDALDPFAGGAIFPQGRLREPLDALARADAFIITRVQGNRRYAGIRKVLRDFNPNAPVLWAHIVPRYWVCLQTGERIDLDELPNRQSGAFCGLANPSAFWTTLATLKISPASPRAFPDHHRYSPSELHALSQTAEILLTTEKDSINLPTVHDTVPIYWLKIGIRIENEAALLEILRRVTG